MRIQVQFSDSPIGPKGENYDHQKIATLTLTADCNADSSLLGGLFGLLYNDKGEHGPTTYDRLIDILGKTGGLTNETS